MVSGSTTLTDPHANFTSGDVNKAIVIQNAEPGGGSLDTTIAADVSSTQITLTTAPSENGTGTVAYDYGTTSAAANSPGWRAWGSSPP